MAHQTKKRMWNKKILYTLCFVAISFIEIVRNCMFVEMEVPTGVIRLTEVLGGLKMQDLWYIASNCTGIVMMIIVFGGYKLKTFFTITNGIWTLICMGIMAFMPYHHNNSEENYHLWQVEVAVINIWWLVIISKYLLSKIIKDRTIKVKWNIKNILWILITLCMTLSVNENKVWPIWYLFMFGTFYLTEYSTEDKENLWNGMIDGSIISFCVVQVMAFFLRPYDELRYMGIHYNSNMAGLYYLIIYTMVLFKLHILQKKNASKIKKAVYLLLGGISLSLQFMTGCRTAWICSIIVTFLYGMFVVKKNWEKTWKKVLLRGVAIVFCMVITFVPIFMAARWLPTVLPIRVWYGGEWENPSKIRMEDAPDSDKYTDLDEFLGEVLGRLQVFGTISKFENPFVMKVYAADSEIVYEYVDKIDPDWLTDEGLRERISIYKAYMEDVTLFGNSNAEGFYYLGDNYYHSWHAQNLWLQIAYYYGGLAGILLIVLSVMLIASGYRMMMKYRGNPYAIIPFFICVVFFCFGLMEVVWNVGQMILFLIFFVNMPLDNIHLIEKRSLESENKN